MTATPDSATRDAVAALAARIRRRDQTDPAERTDPDLAAGEFIAALRQQGWSYIPARHDPADSGPPLPPEEQHQRRAEIREALRNHPHD